MGLWILSYNIHKGFTAGNRKYVLTQIREALRKVPVDIVFLQEVVGSYNGKGRPAESSLATQFEYLADELWPHHAYGKNAVYEGSDHGNAILSKYPIVSYTNTDISTNPLERRGLLHAEISVPGKTEPLHCLNVHLDLLHSGRIKQVQQLCQRIEKMTGRKTPFVLAGDFNDWSGRLSAVIERQTAADELFKKMHNRHARSFPSRLPVLQLDRLYVRGFVPKSASVLSGLPWSRLSDHAPLLAEIE